MSPQHASRLGSLSGLDGVVDPTAIFEQVPGAIAGLGDWTSISDMEVEAREELAEATAFLNSAKGPRVKKALADVVAALEAESVTTPEAKVIPVIDAAKAATNGSDLPAAQSEPQAATRIPACTSDVRGRFNTVNTFSWDQGSYNSPKISVYVPLPGVGTAKDRVSCSFDSHGFDLKVTGLEGKNLRLLQNNLEKEIVPGESKFLVKKDKVILKLQKTKLSYGGYEHWNNLSAKKAKKTDTSNPQGAILDMMKDMYDEGDDNMKKIIGEAMIKSREKGGKPDSFDEPPSYGRGKKGGGSGLGNFDDDMDDLDLDKGVGDYGWGNEVKDDFGFGSKAPPPQAPETGSAAPDDEEEEGEEEDVGGVGVGKVPRMGDGDRVPEAVDGGDANSKNLNALEALDD